MNTDIFEGKWKQMRGQVREWWGKLTDDDLDTIAGKRDKFWWGRSRRSTAGPRSAPSRRSRGGSVSEIEREDRR